MDDVPFSVEKFPGIRVLEPLERTPNPKPTKSVAERISLDVCWESGQRYYPGAYVDVFPCDPPPGFDTTRQFVFDGEKQAYNDPTWALSNANAVKEHIRSRLEKFDLDDVKNTIIEQRMGSELKEVRQLDQPPMRFFKGLINLLYHASRRHATAFTENGEHLGLARINAPGQRIHGLYFLPCLVAEQIGKIWWEELRHLEEDLLGEDGQWKSLCQDSKSAFILFSNILSGWFGIVQEEVARRRATESEGRMNWTEVWLDRLEKDSKKLSEEAQERK